ncbi:hypothetical protein EXH44_09000 [Actinobacillus indolicus]|uniref:Acyltransferase 3 domain-containing protein n=2 Tax=Actinobacillus indolicus TaxID=51049 RepID=A0A4P7CLE8_9PAST|nr:hypothetical protein EXH44_09000 [Actinobacillus indolicus]
MLSGALILPKVVNTDILSFYKKRIPQFIILLFIYSFLTTLVHKLTVGIPLLKSIQDSFKWHNGLYPANIGSAIQLWYMYSIIGLYLIAPFLAKLLDRLTNKEIILFLFISVLLTQFKDTAIQGFRLNIDILPRIGTNMMGAYLNFFILGYLLIHRNIKLSILSSFLLLIVPIIISLIREIHKNEFIGGLHWYSSSLQILLSSIGLLSLLRIYFENKARSKFIEFLSVYSFGVYLLHYIFIYIFKSIIDFSSLSFTAKLMALFIPSFICSYIFAWLLSKHRITRFFVM